MLASKTYPSTPVHRNNEAHPSDPLESLKELKSSLHMQQLEAAAVGSHDTALQEKAMVRSCRCFFPLHRCLSSICDRDLIKEEKICSCEHG